MPGYIDQTGWTLRVDGAGRVVFDAAAFWATVRGKLEEAAARKLAALTTDAGVWNALRVGGVRFELELDGQPAGRVCAWKVLATADGGVLVIGDFRIPLSRTRVATLRLELSTGHLVAEPDKELLAKLTALVAKGRSTYSGKSCRTRYGSNSSASRSSWWSTPTPAGQR